MYMTKKFFKESDQRNVPLNMAYYWDKDAEEFERQGLVGTFGEGEERNWRVFLEDVYRIVVEPDEFGTLTTVAYMNHNNERLYVEI